MSLMEKHFNYILTHGGELPNAEKRSELIFEQLREYTDEITSKVVPEACDKPIICAAYKLLYESLYNMLEPIEKDACDIIVNRTCVTAIMTTNNEQKGSSI